MSAPGCRHEKWEPVTLSTGETVANICVNPACMRDLPVNYQGDNVEMRRLCDVEPTYVPIVRY
jgi:hypothetical protein